MTVTSSSVHGKLLIPDWLATSVRGLLSDAPLEAGCLLLTSFARTRDSIRLLVRDVVPVAAMDYAVRTSSAITLTPACVDRAASRARQENLGITLVHTHPFVGAVHVSSIDRAGESVLVPALRRRLGTAPIARMIVGTDDVHASLLGADDGESLLAVWTVGAELRGWSADEDNGVADDSYERQVRAFSERGQRGLRRLRVAIVG